MDFTQYRRSADWSVDSVNESLLNQIAAEHEYDYDASTNPLSILFFQYIIFSPVISIISICFFVFILAKKELRNNPTCWLVINVLVATMVFGVLILPVTADSFTGGWKLGVVGCHVYTVLSTINYLHLHVGLLLLLIDRFVSFVDQKKHAERMTPKLVRILIVLSLVIVFVLGILGTYLTGMPHTTYIAFNYQYTYCLVDSNSTQILIKVILMQTFPVAQNILLGFITLFTAIAMRRKLNSNDPEERAKNWQAMVLILLVGFLSVLLCLPMNLIHLVRYYGDEMTWFIVLSLDNLFTVLIPILIMVLIPEIRIAMGSCCKQEKKGENQPLVKPM